MTRSSPIYQIKVTLKGVRPPVWRRIEVPGEMRLDTLHETLQVAMGWTDSHLHYFDFDGARYTDPAFDEDGELGMEDETQFELRQLIHKVGQRFIYEYDFGDGWRHTLRLEELLPAEERYDYPRCTAGKRSCPPEDVGGPGGYAYFLEAIADPDQLEHERYLAWIGGAFDPQAFDMQATNTTLRQVIRDRAARPFGPWLAKHALYVHARLGALPASPPALNEANQPQIEDSPLRRDMITLLTYLQDHRVRGTGARGNLTLKAAREISAKMVDPPATEHRIGENVYQLRSAEDVRPLYFLHALSWVGDLTRGGPGSRWRVRPAGEDFLRAPPTDQLWHLFKTWWFSANWAQVSPIGFAGDFVPFDLREQVWASLMDLPTAAEMEFEAYADRLITHTGLVYPIEDQKWARQRLHDMVEDMVIEPLARFGLLDAEYGPHRILGAEFMQLQGFHLTAMGEALLGAIE